MRQTRPAIVALQRRGFAMFGHRRGAEDEACLVDRRNRHAGYKPASHPRLPSPAIRACLPAWNRGRIVGQKRPLEAKHVWAIRVRLEIAQRTRELALFNLAAESRLRGCDLVKLNVSRGLCGRKCQAPRLDHTEQNLGIGQL